MIRRRTLFQGAAFGLASLPFLKPMRAAAENTISSAMPEAAGGHSAKNLKQLVRSRYAAGQRQAVPKMILRDASDDEMVAKADPSTVVSMQDPPGGLNEPQATIAAIAPWHAQSISPGFTSYGPMIAEGDHVVEEWETYFFGEDGTVYNNQYCWVKRFENGKEVKIREYLDSHHAFIVLGLYAPWKELKPPTKPRRRWRPMQPPVDTAGDTIETVFEVTQEFDLDPVLLRDIVPSANPPEQFPATVDGNKALITSLHQAQAEGDVKAVSRFYDTDFRHFIAGEGPLGWNRIPLQDLYAPLIEHLASPIKVRFSPMVSEGGSVFEEMDIYAELDDGTIYNNWHCFIHEIRNGKIVQTREYLDTHHLWVVLGRWATWGKMPVEAPRKIRRSNLPFVSETFQGRNPFLDLERWRPL